MLCPWLRRAVWLDSRATVDGFSNSIGISMPSELWRRWRLWKISRYSKIALASSTRVLQRRRFDSPHLLHRKGQAKPGILRAPGGHQGAVRVFSTRSPRVLQLVDTCLTSACPFRGSLGAAG
jgi:hypothetical protein